MSFIIARPALIQKLSIIDNTHRIWYLNLHNRQLMENAADPSAHFSDAVPDNGFVYTPWVASANIFLFRFFSEAPVPYSVSTKNSRRPKKSPSEDNAGNFFNFIPNKPFFS